MSAPVTHEDGEDRFLFLRVGLGHESQSSMTKIKLLAIVSNRVVGVLGQGIAQSLFDLGGSQVASEASFVAPAHNRTIFGPVVRLIEADV